MNEKRTTERTPEETLAAVMKQVKAGDQEGLINEVATLTDDEVKAVMDLIQKILKK